MIIIWGILFALGIGGIVGGVFYDTYLIGGISGILMGIWLIWTWYKID